MIRFRDLVDCAEDVLPFRSILEPLERRCHLSAWPAGTADATYSGEARITGIGAVNLTVDLHQTAASSLAGTVAIGSLSPATLTGSSKSNRAELSFPGGRIIGRLTAHGSRFRGHITENGRTGRFILTNQSSTIARSSAAARQTPSIPRYDHVVIVMEENSGYGQILGPSLDPPLGYPLYLWPSMLAERSSRPPTRTFARWRQMAPSSPTRMPSLTPASPTIWRSSPARRRASPPTPRPDTRSPRRTLAAS